MPESAGRRILLGGFPLKSGASWVPEGLFSRLSEAAGKEAEGDGHACIPRFDRVYYMTYGLGTGRGVLPMGAEGRAAVPEALGLSGEQERNKKRMQAETAEPYRNDRQQTGGGIKPAPAA